MLVHAGPVANGCEYVRSTRPSTGQMRLTRHQTTVDPDFADTLGLGAGLLANMLIPGRRSQGLILTCLIGVAGALGGGWLATKLFHIHTLHGFFNLSTWLTAIAGAAILLLIFHLVTSRQSTSGRRRTSWAHR